jgi:phosphopantothenate-cysteine ligase
LETDEALLPDKSKQALKRYGHQLVVGNLLRSRKQRVIFFYKRPNASGEEFAYEPVELSGLDVEQKVEIESLIVPRLISRHTEWIKASDDKG